MTCEQVREQLAEHLLGTLDETVDREVRVHLRGCGSCRAELRAMADGVGTFAAAAHDVDPPGELRQRVLSTLDEEWASAAPAGVRSGRPGRVAVIAALAAALAWGAVATVLALNYEEAADKYETFLAQLGGENVRVGALRAEGPQDLQGSVVSSTSPTLGSPGPSSYVARRVGREPSTSRCSRENAGSTCARWSSGPAAKARRGSSPRPT